MKIVAVSPGKKFVAVVSSDASAIRLRNGGLIIIDNAVTLDEQKAEGLIDALTAEQSLLDVNPYAALEAMEKAVKGVVPDSEVSSRVFRI